MLSARQTAIYPLVVVFILTTFLSCHRVVMISPGIKPGVEGSPLIRVRLSDGVKKVRLGGAESDILITDAASGEKIARLLPGVEWDAVSFGPQAQLRLAMPDGKVSKQHPAGIRLKALTEPEMIKVNGKIYRGAVYVYSDRQGGLMAVNFCPLEQYLRSVVPAEMGVLEDRYMEALKAQAVASRSFAMAQMARNQTFLFDVTANTDDQVYKGLANENREADRAVLSTSGECLIRGGKVITAFYHSTCGGRTAAPEEVWGKRFAQDNPYLESVKDEKYDQGSKWYNWEEKWTRKELLERIKKALPSIAGLSAEDVGEPGDIEVVEKGPSGRNVLLKVTTDKRVLQISGDAIRNVLRTRDGRILPSTFFTLSVARESSGPVIIARGKGFGHGLGMCQTGAQSRAENGDSYARILKAYYKGVKVLKVY